MITIATVPPCVTAIFALTLTCSFYATMQRRGRRAPTNVAQSDKYASLKHIDSFHLPYNHQDASSLFQMPAEIRDSIWAYVLADYEDLTNAYSVDTCYRRPGYMGPRRTDTAVLRTCQAIYDDAWYLPWTLAQHTFYLAATSRKPARTTEVRQMQQVSGLIERLHPDVPNKRKEIHNVQIFGQLCSLESGAALNDIFRIQNFCPRQVSITIRHTDIWSWESDSPIYIGTQWVKVIRLPATVMNLQIQLESLERRQPQIDYVVQRAKEWVFERSDGGCLVCNTPIREDRWAGSSTWERQRWIRDEDDREPGMLRYYIATMAFRPADKDEGSAVYQERNARRDRIPDKIRVPNGISTKTRMQSGRYAWLPSEQLDSIGVTSNVKASEALKLYLEHQDRQRAARAASQSQTSP